MVDRQRLTNALKITFGVCVAYFLLLGIVAGFFKFLMILPFWLGSIILLSVVLVIMISAAYFLNP